MGWKIINEKRRLVQIFVCTKALHRNVGHQKHNRPLEPAYVVRFDDSGEEQFYKNVSLNGDVHFSFEQTGLKKCGSPKCWAETKTPLWVR